MLQQIELIAHLISIQLLRSAKKGARGKAATKMVMKPNWRTEKRQHYHDYFTKSATAFCYVG